MIKRDYYSVRKDITNQQVSFEVLKKIFLSIFDKLKNEECFLKYLGEDSTKGYSGGELGDIQAVLFVNLKKENLFPVEKHINDYSEDDFFDIVEFLYDHCSKKIYGNYLDSHHNLYHYEFDDIKGRKYFRNQLNPFLRKYKDGFEISEDGEILKLAENGLSTLLNAEIPTNDEDNIKKRMNAAKLKFRGYRSTLEDRKEAIRELADVLEFIRPQVKQFDKKNEQDIFTIANNYGIRHHNLEQKTDYDRNVWYSWIFYYYLATIHAVLRMKEKQ